MLTCLIIVKLDLRTGIVKHFQSVSDTVDFLEVLQVDCENE